VLLVSLTARGDQTLMLTQPISNALTPLDDTPSTGSLDPLFTGSGGTAAGLQAIAVSTDTNLDFGVQLNAIRTLPMYCPSGSPRPSCGVGTIAHDTLAAIIDGYTLLPSPTAKDLLRLRAAIEALGLAGFSAGLPADVERLINKPSDTPPGGDFLANPSRDVRATTARALGSLCNTQAIGGLHVQLQGEKIPQVRLAISAALRDLGQCPGG
jgi:hypothetical protein